MSNTAKINTIITNDNTQFKKSINDCDKQVQGFSKGSMANIGKMIAGAFAVEKIAEWGKAQLEMADNMVTLADSIGITTDSLQALYSTGRHSNINTEDIDKGLSKLANAQDEVVNGNKATIESFQKLGISADEVVSSDLEGLFQKVANGAQTSATAINDVNDIFGKNMGIKMKPLLQEIADQGFGGITEQARQAGEMIEAIDLKQMANMADDLEHAFKRASDWLVKGIMKVFGFVKDIAAVMGAMAGGSSFSNALGMLARDEIGTGADRKKAEADVQKEKDQKELERLQKVEQQKTNIKKVAEEKYQNELEKMLKEADEKNLKNAEKAAEKSLKKREKLAELSLKKLEIEKEVKEKLAEIDQQNLENKGGIKEGIKPNLTNSLQSQGAGLGSGVSSSYSIQEQQLKVAEKIADINKKTWDAQCKTVLWSEKQLQTLEATRQAILGN